MTSSLGGEAGLGLQVRAMAHAVFRFETSFARMSMPPRRAMPTTAPTEASSLDELRAACTVRERAGVGAGGRATCVGVADVDADARRSHALLSAGG